MSMRRIFMLSGVMLLVLAGVLAFARQQKPMPPWIYCHDYGQLYRVKWDGSDLEKLPSEPFSNFIALSTDNRWFVTFDYGIGEQVLRRTETSFSRAIYISKLYRLVWSPDSRKFGVVSDDLLQLYEIDNATWQTIDISVVPQSIVNWSPDGRWILIFAEVSGNQQLFRVSPDSMAIYQYEINGTVAFPTWSPDGHWIAFIEQDSDDVFVMRGDGSELTNLTNTPRIIENDVMWDASSQWLYYNSDSKVIRVRPDGTERREFDERILWPPQLLYDGWLVSYGEVEGNGEIIPYLYRFNVHTGEKLQLTRGTADQFLSVVPPIDLPWHPAMLAIGTILATGTAAIIRISRKRKR